MGKGTNGARHVGVRASLGSLSVSPPVSTMGRAACQECKLELAFCAADDDPCSKGRNVLGVNGDNHRGGLIHPPRVSARDTVPPYDNWGRLVIADCLPDI